MTDPSARDEKKRRKKRNRRLRSALSWVFTLVVLALALPTPLGRPHLGVTIVSGPSMQPTYHLNDLLITWRTNAYPVGTPIVYNVPEGEEGAGLAVVHRVIETRPDGTHVTQGDNNNYTDPWLPTDENVRGEVVVAIPKGGWVLSVFVSPLVLAAVTGILTTASVLARFGDEFPRPKPRNNRKRNRKRPRDRSGGLGAAVQRTAVAVTLVGLAFCVPTAHASALMTIDDGGYLGAWRWPSSAVANPVASSQEIVSEGPLEFCSEVTVTNFSDQAVEWEIGLSISEQPFNATALNSSYGVTTVSFSLNQWRVRGEGYNSVIAPGGSYVWGYCGARATTALVDVAASVNITTQDAQSYCATVTMSTASTAWVRWRATLDHATTGVSLDPYWLATEPSNTNNVTPVSFDSNTGVWVTRGVASNEYIRAGTDATWGYCAPVGAASPLVEATLGVSITSSDSQQYCATVNVSTLSPTYVKWKATIGHTTPNLTGQSYWLAAAPTPSNGVTVSFDAETGTWVVKGQAYNQLIRSDTPASFSFCAPVNPNAELVAADVAVSVSSSSPTNYCVNVTASTTSNDWIKWKAMIGQTTPNLPATPLFTSAPSNFWNVTSVSFAAGTWTVRGVGWNVLIKAGSPQSFGFCVG